ncbi:hypothetical protein M408DRAFT_28616 [Serendipita vermifera MAFF 305830]|uniref:F-box domain-containing protein n=1 Tax=Serendipita vermifera MAFF 305830 TaxID=933852 RepID=A0A0C3AD64_SERVB|nr:hypothetical protein M408DRAFT_28616 [Serendipita vermifera MAFF 305830]
MVGNSPRRATILAEIAKLNEDFLDTEPTGDRVYHLQPEYNRLVDEESVPSPLGDPLEILPPELWKNIMPDNSDDSLVLTAVSSRWCHKLLSTPVLWSTIWLNQIEHDSMAKAIALIHLSRSVELDVHIHLPLEVWREVTPLIVPESARIRRLWVYNKGDSSSEEWLSLLCDLGNLPALRYLSLPFFNSVRSYGARGLESIGDCYYPPQGLPFHRMPALRNLPDLSFTAELLNGHGLSELESIRIRNLSSGMTSALSKISNLAHIRFDDEFLNHNDIHLESTDRTKEYKLAVRFLEYNGNFIVPNLLCVGNILVQIDSTVNIYDVEALLVALSDFSVLTSLTLSVFPERIHRTVPQIEAFTFRSTSVQFVELYFAPGTFSSDEYGTKKNEIGQKADLDNQIYHSIFRALTKTVPLANRVHLGGQFVAEPALRYVLSLRQLKILHFAPSLPHMFERGRPITPHLLRTTCFPFLIPVDFFDRIPWEKLESLEISNDILYGYFGRYLEEDILHELQDLISYPPPSHKMQNLGVLRIQMVQTTSFDPDNFSSLRSISFRAWSQQDVWASELLEEIILRPNILPSLEQFGLEGIFIEWDILILMLERRNLVAERGTARIKTLIFKGPLSYELLYPITQLLKGKFPKRPSLEELSVEVIGSRLFNPRL